MPAPSVAALEKARKVLKDNDPAQWKADEKSLEMMDDQMDQFQKAFAKKDVGKVEAARTKMKAALPTIKKCIDEAHKGAKALTDGSNELGKSGNLMTDPVDQKAFKQLLKEFSESISHLVALLTRCDRTRSRMAQMLA